LAALGRHGRLLTCGATAGFDPKTDLRYIWSFEFNIIGCNGWTPDDQIELLNRVADGPSNRSSIANCRWRASARR
jgi:alcohol dehydrogenase